VLSTRLLVVVPCNYQTPPLPPPPLPTTPRTDHIPLPTPLPPSLDRSTIASLPTQNARIYPTSGHNFYCSPTSIIQPPSTTSHRHLQHFYVTVIKSQTFLKKKKTRKTAETTRVKKHRITLYSIHYAIWFIKGRPFSGFFLNYRLCCHLQMFFPRNVN